MKSATRTGALAWLARARIVATAAVVGLGLLSGAVNPSPVEASTWQIGDVFAGVESGDYKVYDNAGTFKETISHPTFSGFTTGCAFNDVAFGGPDAEAHVLPAPSGKTLAAAVPARRVIVPTIGLDSKVTFRTAEPAAGDPSGAPYDVIVLNGATEIAPETLYGQLKEGGRLVGVFAMTRPARAMIVRRSHGEFGSRPLFDAAAPLLPGLGRVPEFVF